jgi:hypothetical protein
MYGIFENATPTSLAGVFGLIYMIGWFCSIWGLYKLNAAGDKKGRVILIIQMILLTVGNLWNIYSIIDPGCDTVLFHITDFIGWPFDNIFMLVTGIAIVRAKQLDGWKRFVPLLVGLWFPLTVVTTRIFFQSSSIELIITSLYSVSGWGLLGITVYLSGRDEETEYGPGPRLSSEDMACR